MLTQTFSYKNEPIKMADTFLILNKGVYSIDIKNVRLSDLRDGSFVADVIYKQDNKTLMNDVETLASSSISPVIISDISTLTKDPTLFIKYFDSIDKYPSDLNITFTIDAPLKNASQEVKNFYKTQLNAEALNGYWRKIKAELNQRKEKNKKIEGELKESLIRKILRSFSLTEKNKVANTVIIGCILVGLLTPFGIFSHLASVTFNIPLWIILAGQALAVVSMALTLAIGSNIVARSKKRQVEVLKKLGELENENIDSPNSKSHLVAKLESLYETNSLRDDFANTIEVGQKSFSSYFERFKNLFTLNAYHPGYYVGQEMAAQKKTKPQ